MSHVTVSELAVREMIKETLDDNLTGDFPVNVIDVVDPSAGSVDQMNPNFVPQTKQEFVVAIQRLIKDVPICDIPKIYGVIDTMIKDDEQKTEEDEKMKKVTQGGTNSVEESIRRAVRKILSEINPNLQEPSSVSSIETDDVDYSSSEEDVSVDDEDEDDEEEEVVNKKTRPAAYKATAIGNMEDVGGDTFEKIAQELDFSVAGAKQAVDKALEKYGWLFPQDETGDLELMVLDAMNDYVDMLNKSGELSPGDVALMKDHPDIIRELDGFREYLSNTIRRERKLDNQQKDVKLDERQALTSPEKPKCESCNKPLTNNDKRAYEAEGGSGWPSTHEICAGKEASKKPKNTTESRRFKRR